MVVVAWFLLLAFALPAQAQQAEPQLKAAVASKLPAFAEWPDAATASRDAIEICVPRSAKVSDQLASLVAGELVAGKPLRVREITGPLNIASCHVLFIPTSSDDAAGAMLKPSVGNPILTIGDSPRFLDQGGIVALRLIDGRIRFEINLAAANQSGIRLSSQLLKLAVSVRGTPQ